MANSRKKLHKTVFDALSADVAPTFMQHGFVKHPAYEDGWDRYNQEYTVNLIKDEFLDHICQLKIAYWPQYSRVRVEIIRSENTLGLKSLEDCTTIPHDWTDQWLYRPFTTLTLKSGRYWNPFSMSNAFKVRLREGRDPSAELARLVLAINKKAPYLLDAMAEQDRQTYVNIDHHHLGRPSG